MAFFSHRLIAIAWMGLCLGIWGAGKAAAQGATRIVIHVEDTTGDGVKCAIYKVDSDPQKSPYWCADVDEHGNGVVTDPGKPGESLRPVSITYAPVADVHCPLTPPGPIVIKVHKRSLTAQAELFRKMGKPATAAYIFERAADKQPKHLVARTDVETARAMGDYLGVTQSVVRDRGKLVPSEQLEAAVSDFQRKSNISKIDGKLDPVTLKAAAKAEAAVPGLY